MSTCEMMRMIPWRCHLLDWRSNKMIWKSCGDCWMLAGMYMRSIADSHFFMQQLMVRLMVMCKQESHFM